MPDVTAPDSHFMALALEQAQLAADAGEVPVGAVLVKDGQVIAVGRNAPIAGHDPTAHAEIAALRAGAAALQNYRLDGCTLFVTLEPCAMCAGALLHARLSRVVYGAADPKTGAAGSVVDLFTQAQLNHHTQIDGGVLESSCASVLHQFFEAQRAKNRLAASPLREDALRTPPARFLHLSDYPWEPHFISDLSALAGLRMHYLDEGARNAPRVFLCLHGFSHWSYFFRYLLPALCATGGRVVVPDLIGFGKSDKPKREAIHTRGFHRQVLFELIHRLDLRNVILLVHADLAAMAQAIVCEVPERCIGLFTLPQSGANPSPHCRIHPTAYDAPFPDAGHRAAMRAWGAAGNATLWTSEPDEFVAQEVLQQFTAG